MTSVQQTSTKDDILTYLLRQGEATAHDLAEHLEVSAQAIRRHLKDLEAETLIEHRAVQEGMGRPNYLYHLSAKGRDRLPAKYDEFAISLLDTLAEAIATSTQTRDARKAEVAKLDGTIKALAPQIEKLQQEANAKNAAVKTLTDALNAATASLKPQQDEAARLSTELAKAEAALSKLR
jgi:predicted ArsR family transcriptional regulator